jgi:hypothetical protein
VNPLLRHVGDLVHTHDALAMARGGTWKELWIRTCIPGGCSTDVRYHSDGKAIRFDRSPEGPGVVTWAEFADMIRSGLTDHLVADLEAAMADWNRYNHDPDNRGDLTYSSCSSWMRELERQIVANALGAQPVQLDLFGAVA